MAEMVDVEYEPLPSFIADKYYLLGLSMHSFREPLNECIRAVMIPRIQDNFSSGSAAQWAPLAEATKLDRKEYGFAPTPILVRTGLLKRTASQINIWNVDSEKAYVSAASFGGAQGGKAWYGLAQNEGYVGGYGAATPARPFLVFTEEDVDKMTAIFNIWMYEKEIEAGFKMGDPA